MFFVLRLFALLLVSLGLALPAAVGAEERTETVTIHVNVHLPTGTDVLGTVVLDRTCGVEETQSLATFNGMVNGTPATFNATAIERWYGNGNQEVEIVATDVKTPVLGSVPLRSFRIVQTAPGMGTVEGIPAAIDGTLEAPCSGRTSYTVTTAGQGSQSITELPRTGTPTLLANPITLTLLLTTVGGAMLVAGVWMGKRRVAQYTSGKDA